MPDFWVAATNLPYVVYRTCTTCPLGNPCVPALLPQACTTADLDTYAFTATFAPTVAGPLSCVVTITLDTGTRTLTLSGTGMAPPVAIDVTPATLAFGDVRSATDSSPATVNVSDLGGSALTVAATSDFTVAAPRAFTVAPGASHPVAVICHHPRPARSTARS